MIAYVLIICGFLFRLIPHVPNVVPVAAIAIFAGAYLDKRIAPWLPLAIMVLSDLIIGMHRTVFFTWGAFLLIGFMATWLKDHRSLQNVFAASILSAILFFVISNFGAWLVMGEYPPNLAGFVTCYVRAIPFFRNTLISNVAGTFVLFGLYEIAKRALERSRLYSVLFVG